MSVGSIAHPAIVVIDPGHGGIDRGGIPGQKLAKKVLTLDTGKGLARILQSNGGLKVVMTRYKDRSFRRRKEQISQTSMGGVTRYSFRFITTPHDGRVRAGLRRSVGARKTWLA